METHGRKQTNAPKKEDLSDSDVPKRKYSKRSKEVIEAKQSKKQKLEPIIEQPETPEPSTPETSFDQSSTDIGSPDCRITSSPLLDSSSDFENSNFLPHY